MKEETSKKKKYNAEQGDESTNKKICNITHERL